MTDWETVWIALCCVVTGWCTRTTWGPASRVRILTRAQKVEVIYECEFCHKKIPGGFTYIGGEGSRLIVVHPATLQCSCVAAFTSSYTWGQL